jgi:hypothetical protein
MGSIWAIVQGLVALVAPQRSVSFVKRMLGMNFENADQLTARDSYVRQIRALGIGLASAGIASFVMESVVDDGGDADGDDVAPDDDHGTSA